MREFFNKTNFSDDYRREAKEICSLKADVLALIYLVYFGVFVVASMFDNFTSVELLSMNFFNISSSDISADLSSLALNGQLHWFNGVFSLICGGPFAISFAYIAKNVYNDKDVDVVDLFKGFKDFGRALIIYVLEMVFILLWFLLFVIPGIIKMFSYAMAYFVAIDNKNMSAKECLKESQRLMDGHKWDYFCLIFSYIGWIFLSVLTFGILFLWVLPRIEQATYLFYLDISGKGLNPTSDEEEFVEEVIIEEK